MFVAHRLRTIYDSDQIIVLHNGRVAESGTHLHLLKQSGLYAELWNGNDTSKDPHEWLTANIASVQENLLADSEQPQSRDEND